MDDALARFSELVAQWNARTDLTSARDDASLEEVLFLDARELADTELVPERARLVDVGAGVGAPSLPLALLRPDVDVTLVEPRRRRVAFLRTAIGSLGLAERARVVEDRVDPDAPRVVGMPFDAALSRATFAPPRWLEVGGRLAPRVLVLTAAGAPPAPPPDWAVAAARDYAVPSSGAPRTITAYARVRAAPPE